MSDFSIRFDFANIPDEQLEVLTQQIAGQLLLLAVRTLTAAGYTANAAFRLGSYFALRQLYGREFVRQEFGITRRTEQLWSKQCEEAALQLPDEPRAEDYEFGLRAAAAFEKTRQARGE